jgi:hypothetical protein
MNEATPRRNELRRDLRLADAAGVGPLVIGFAWRWFYRSKVLA